MGMERITRRMADAFIDQLALPSFLQPELKQRLNELDKGVGLDEIFEVDVFIDVVLKDYPEFWEEAQSFDWESVATPTDEDVLMEEAADELLADAFGDN